MRSNSVPEPIAIIGIGCTFPGARGPNAFWDLLRHGREAIREIPLERFDINHYHDPTPGTPGKIVTRRGGFIENIDLFDSGFFGISPREADSMDPQQRLLLEVAWEAVEDAGLTRSKLINSATGVFIGMSSSDYSDMQLRIHDSSSMDVYTLPGTARSILAGRISHLFDLKGPSLAVDTACSSSLVAAHLACQSIWNGECSMAMAGGVNVILTPESWSVLSLARIISPDGVAKVFDARANGFVRGEGAGMVVLKPLAQAQSEGDPIYAVIRGSAINNDGHNSSVMTPNQQSQEAVLRSAYHQAGICPGQVHYVEAHGTGTSVGDPIEARALGIVMAEGRNLDTPCLVGSVKTNIGHLEAGAGIAGLIKVALCLKHRGIPASLNFEIPNPAVPWSELPLMVSQEYREWPVSQGIALAGVSSFGISGTNVHMVLSDTPTTVRDKLRADANGAHLLPLSAHTPEALFVTAERFRDFLSNNGDKHSLYDLCYNASIRRTHYMNRITFVIRSKQELAAQLESYCRNTLTTPTDITPRDKFSGPVFVFSGQGAKFWPLDAGLLTAFDVFKDTLLHCENLLRAQGADWSLLDQLTAKDENSRMIETDISQTSIFACQVALAAQWRAWGIEPSAVIGHSLGEVAAAHVAGAISLEQAIHIVFHRGLITKQASGKGDMALVGLPRIEAGKAIKRYDDRLSVAVSNSPTASVLSGDPIALNEVLEELEQKSIFVRRLSAIDYAAHSQQMEPLKHQLARALDNLIPCATSIPFYSTVTTRVINGTELHARYWADNLREPVRFDETLQRALVDDHRCFLEVHPTQVLLRPIQEVFEQVECKAAIYPSLLRDADSVSSLLRSLGGFYRHGYPVCWEKIYPTGARHITLPSIPWQRRRHWLAGENKSGNPIVRSMISENIRHPLLGVLIQSAAQPDSYIVQVELSRNRPHYLTDHRVYDTVVFPATAYIEMSLAIAEALDQAGKHTLLDLAFEKALVLSENGVVSIQISVIKTNRTISLDFYSTPGNGISGSWIHHAKATVITQDGDGRRLSDLPLAPTIFQNQSDVKISGVDHYKMMATQGLHYGPLFQGISQLWLYRTEVLAQIDLPKSITAELPKYQIHPVLLDVAFQSVAAMLQAVQPQTSTKTFLPVALKSLQIHHSPQQVVYTHAVLHSTQDETRQRIVADVCLLDDEGRILVEAKGLVLQQLKGSLSSWRTSLDQYLYQVSWQPQPLPAPDMSTSTDIGRWLVIGNTDGLGDAIAKQLRFDNKECLLIGSDNSDKYQLDLTSLESVHRFIAQLSLAEKSLSTILYLAAPNTAPQQETGVPLSQTTFLGLLHLVQALAQHDAVMAPRLWVVTRGAQSVTKNDQIILNQASLWGLIRTIALEFPRFRCSSIDLYANSESEEVVCIYQELQTDGAENQIAYHQEKRYVPRLTRYKQNSINRERPIMLGEAYRLEMSAPGILDNLRLTVTQRVEPEPDQVEIRVHSAGLNFLDVLSALGLRPDQTDSALILGMECAGTVTQVGKNVTNVKVGDEVLAVAPHSIGNLTRTLADLVILKPAKLSFQEAATVPIAYLTAYYALYTLGRLRAGERILIHSAVGGVGLAAVYLAQRLGAEIYATAGSPEKRAFLQQLGVQYVMDSRSLDFADEVMSFTNGEGVDLVLNSLAGEAIPRSLAILRANGRFLEIGKRDIYGRSRLDMGLLKKNIAFFAIDLIPLMTDMPTFCAELLESLFRMFDDDSLPPLPYIEFPIARAEEAFRYMAQAKHMGKIVIRAELSVDDMPLQIISQSRGAKIWNDGTYLITGGLGGLGLCVAEWLVEKGAHHLVLVSRSQPSPQVSNALIKLESQGVAIIAVQSDVSCATEVEALLKRIEESMPPLRGIFHAAGVLDDGMLLQMNGERFQRVIAPKVDGAWLLHQLTSHLDLDLFVLFSSATSILGSPGQGNYALANAFLDGLAHYRHRQGLPAISINWGAWSGVGMAEQLNRAEHLAQQGIIPFTPAQGVHMLEQILATPDVQVMAINVDWSRLLNRFAIPLLQEMAADASVTHNAPGISASSDLRKKLQSLTPAEQQQAITDLLQKQIAQVLRTPILTVSPNQPLNELGIDSLMMVELVNRVESDLALTLPMSTLLQSPTIDKLSELVMSLLGSQMPSESDQNRTVDTADVIPDEHLVLHVEKLLGEAVLDPSIRITTSIIPVNATPSQLFLTGGTGFLGKFLLRDLLLKTSAQIHCLVRSEDDISGRQRLIQSIENTFPGEQLELGRIVVVSGDLAQPQFGLSQSAFDILAEQSDLIIHCGAQIKWLAPYDHLKPVNVFGTQSILQLAAYRRLKPLHFVSSLAVFPIVTNGASLTINERTPLAHDGMLYGGYAQSKWVAEKLVETALERGLPTMVYRPSLIVGHSQTGVWQGNNIIVNMLRSWIELGIAPDIEAHLDLISVDYVSDAIVRLALCNGNEAGKIYHLNNSHTVSVGELIDWLIACGYAIRKMPYQAWRSEMLKRGDLRRQTILDSVGPLLALQVSEDVEWLGHMPHFGNLRTQHALKDMTCPSMDVSVFRTYVEYLKQTGALPSPD